MYRPLPDILTIKKSPIDKLGLFATVNIEKGYLFGISHILDTRFDDDYIRTPLGGFINHSEEPNCKLVLHEEPDMERNCIYLIAIKDILKDEEITTSYSLYEIKFGENYD